MAVNEEIATRLRRIWRIATGVRSSRPPAAVLDLRAELVRSPTGGGDWPQAAKTAFMCGVAFRGLGRADLVFEGEHPSASIPPTRCDRLLPSRPHGCPVAAEVFGVALDSAPSGVFATVLFDRGAENHDQRHRSRAGVTLVVRSGWKAATEQRLRLGGTSAPLLDAGRLAAGRACRSGAWSSHLQPGCPGSPSRTPPVRERTSRRPGPRQFVALHAVRRCWRWRIHCRRLAFEALRVRRTLRQRVRPAGGVDPATDMVIPAWQTRASAGTADVSCHSLFGRIDARSKSDRRRGPGVQRAIRFALRGRYARYARCPKTRSIGISLRSHARRCSMRTVVHRSATFDPGAR